MTHTICIFSPIQHTRPEPSPWPLPHRPLSPVPCCSAEPRAAAARALGTEAIIDRVRRKIVERGGSSGIAGVARLMKVGDLRHMGERSACIWVKWGETSVYMGETSVSIWVKQVCVYG